MFFLPLARGDAYRSDCHHRPGSAFSRPDMERFDVTRTGTSSHSGLTRHRRANGLRRHPLVAYIFFPIGCPNFLGRSGQSRLVIFRLPSLAHLGRVIDTNLFLENFVIENNIAYALYYVNIKKITFLTKPSRIASVPK